MDLPTCPACGQSVLEDDVETCPFCGATMDGSRGSKAVNKKSPVQIKRSEESADKPVVRKVKSASELAATEADLAFDTASDLTVNKGIRCAPQRTKSRTLRVVCPMCDTAGYVPPAAAGRTVRCCNSNCMVPLFTASNSSTAEVLRMPGSISEDAIRQEERVLSAPPARNPAVTYGVIGAVTLLAGIGLKYFFEREPDVSRFDTPLGTKFSYDAAEDLPVADVPVPRVKATDDNPAAVIEEMVPRFQAATTQNSRDKELCLREKADALIRLGQLDDAEKEFARLLAVSQSRVRNDYYRVEPRLRNYWQALSRGETSSAAESLKSAEADAASIPAMGLLGLRSTIALAAALVNESAPEKAGKLHARHDHDRTVRAEVDDLYRGAWMALSVALNEANVASPSPLECLTWKNPLTTVTAAVLAVKGSADQAIEWAASQSDPEVRSDAFAAIARFGGPFPEVNRLIEAAAASGASTEFRVRSALARSDASLLDAVAAGLLSGDVPNSAPFPDPADMMDFRASESSDSNLSALAYAEFAAAAAQHHRDDDAVKAIHRLFGELSRQIAPTLLIREGCAEMDKSEDAIHKLIRSRLGLPATQKVTSEFRRYRMGLDRLGRAAEDRRMHVIHLLSVIAEADGGRTLARALSENQQLAEELQLDSLCLFVAAAALSAGGDIPALSTVTEVKTPRGERINGLAEEDIVLAWFNVVQSKAANRQMLELEAIPSLPGLRSSLLQRLFEQRAIKEDITVLDAITEIENNVCRENSLFSSAVWLTRAGHRQKIENWLESQKGLSPTELVMSMSGIIAGLPKPGGASTGSSSERL